MYSILLAKPPKLSRVGEIGHEQPCLNPATDSLLRSGLWLGASEQPSCCLQIISVQPLLDASGQCFAWTLPFYQPVVMQAKLDYLPSFQVCMWRSISTVLPPQSFTVRWLHAVWCLVAKKHHLVSSHQRALVHWTMLSPTGHLALTSPKEL